MFDSGIFDVVIGLVLVYLLLSLIASAIQELVAKVFRWRARDLEEGLLRLLIDSNAPQNAQPQTSTALEATQARDLVKELYNHPLIQSLTIRKSWWDTIRKKPTRPSYIPNHTFALALLDIITGETSGNTRNLEQLRQQIQQIQVDTSIPETVRRALLVLVNDAGIGNAKGALNNIEDWFDNMMQRLSSLYKSKVQHFLLPLGLLISVLFNADSIMIARTLWQDGPLRASVVAAAVQITREGLPENQSGTDLISGIITQTREIGLPLGWNQRHDDPNDPTKPPRWSSPLDFDLGGWAFKVLGLLATTLAISQGAPFWFDLLNKFMEFRSTLKPPAPASSEPIAPGTSGGGDGSGNASGGSGPGAAPAGGSGSGGSG